MDVPLALRVDPLAAMLNCELAGHPVYDGLELQWFDDDVHGTGMLAFLSRRGTGLVDYYADPALRLDPSHYSIGGGTGTWTTTTFDVARLHVAEDGVDAAARFTDIDGRPVEVVVNDRDGKRRRPAGLLAPVSSAITHPTALMLVWLPAFDLVRRTPAGTEPVIRIDGQDAAIGALPGAWLHRRHLIKYAAPVVAVDINPDDAVLTARPAPEPGSAATSAPAQGPGDLQVQRTDGVVVGVRARTGDHTADLTFHPGLPDLATLPDGEALGGVWAARVDDVVLTGGAWHATRAGGQVHLGLDVTRRWHPHRLPVLMRMVTTVVPVFRRWPTTYRWRAHVDLDSATVTSARWERTGSDGGDSYRRATGS